jgi:hypothetical protein
MAARKFNVGDSVLINLASKHLTVEIRDYIAKNPSKVRRIEAIYYYHRAQHVSYYLGRNHNGRGLDISSFMFRACDLIKYQMKYSTRRRKISKARLDGRQYSPSTTSH